MKSCKRCGQCCRQSIIDEVYELDLIREPRLRAFVEPVKQMPGLDDDEQRYMLKTPCLFLKWEWDKRDGWKRVGCSIYPSRPNICVAYEPGSSPICSQYINKEQPCG